MNSCANSLQLRFSEVQNFIAAQLPVHHQGANKAESTGLTPGKSEGYAILLARVDDYEAVEGRETMGNMDIHDIYIYMCSSPNLPLETARPFCKRALQKFV